MANRRMFSKKVISSGRFLRMPPSSRLLYYDLGMEADDDGVVEAFSVIRTTGATEDDLRVLAARQFITILNDDLVSYINEWHENNYIRTDRYTPSIYKGLLVKVAPTLPEPPRGVPHDNQWSADGIPDDNQVPPQDRLGKDRLGKDRGREGKPSRSKTKVFSPPTLDDVVSYFASEKLATQPEAFFDFYKANGWTVSNGNSMKDWKAAARMWARREERLPVATEPAAPKVRFVT